MSRREAAHPITLNANYGFPQTATSTVTIINDRFTPLARAPRELAPFGGTDDNSAGRGTRTELWLIQN